MRLGTYIRNMQINRLAFFRAIPAGCGDSVLVAFVAVGILFISCPAHGSPGPFSTFLQQKAGTPQAVGHDAAGNIIAVWNSDSAIPGHGMDLVAAKFDASAANLLYFVELGGSGGDTVATALAVDAQGNAYITGATGAANFPVTTGFNGQAPANTAYPFAVKLSPGGTIVYATLYAGAAAAEPLAIAADSSGDAVISGLATTAYTATAGAVSVADAACGSCEPFVTKLDPSGSKILFSAVGVGGGQVVLGPQGDIFIAGSTSSAAYPTTAGAYQTSFTPSVVCGSEGFCMPSSVPYVSRLSADGSKLVYSTLLSGSEATCFGLAVDSAGDAYVTGTTSFQDYPFTPASPGDRPGLFLAKLDPSGSRVLWSVKQGGTALALDASGNPIVGGSFLPTTIPASYSPAQTFPPPPPTGSTPVECLPNGITVRSMAYVQRFSAQDGSTLATQLLSATQATANAVTIEPDGRVVLAGRTSFPDVPLSAGVVFSNSVAQRTASGGFLAAFDLSQTAAGPQLGCVLDAATLLPIGPVAPGQLISLFGSQLGPDTGVAAPDPTSPPASLSNVQVSFDGVPAPLLYVSSRQVNVQAPPAVMQDLLQQGSTVMTVSIDSHPVLTRMFAVTGSSPSVFGSTYGGTRAGCPAVSPVWFQAIALNSDGSVNSCANPAPPGSAVTLFLHGAGVSSGQIGVSAGPVSLAAGPLLQAPGMIDGVDMLAVALPQTDLAGLQPVPLAISAGDTPAAPFVYSGGAFQEPVVVWMSR